MKEIHIVRKGLLYEMTSIRHLLFGSAGPVLRFYRHEYFRDQQKLQKRR